MSDPRKIAIVTGASRGIGEAIVTSLAKRGYRVYATMRDPSVFSFDENTVEGEVISRKLDVTDAQSIQSTLSEIISLEGRVDLLVNNAGYGLLAPVEFAHLDDVKDQFDVNVYGVLRMVQAILPLMRQQRSGHIINISSISGVVSNPFLGVYSATKHAVEAISASLAATLLPWNVKVSVIEPGSVATDFAVNMSERESSTSDNPYVSCMNKYRDEITERLTNGQQPTEVGELVARVAEDKNAHFRYQTSDSVEELAAKFIVDITGDDMIETLAKPIQLHFKSDGGF